jgi:3-oxoacyl-[acyl-carrier-protein] synthase-3
MGIRIIDAAMASTGLAQSTTELAALLDQDPDWLVAQTGVRQRFISEVGTDPTALAAMAARELLNRTACSPDLVVYGCSVDRQSIPDGAVFVLKHLGLSGIGCFSVRATCLSFIVALHAAASAIERGDASCVLIAIADLPSQSRNFDDPVTAALLGDGAAAVLLERDDTAAALRWSMQTWPEHSELSEIRGGGLLNPPFSVSTTNDCYQFEMDGPGLMRVALSKLKRFLPEFLDKAEVTMDEIDWVVPHQASLLGFRLLYSLGVPSDKTIDILAEFGNCAAASMPIALASAWQGGRIRQGHRILFLGTAAGFSIGAALIQC